jgi:hypothetical protein
VQFTAQRLPGTRYGTAMIAHPDGDAPQVLR